MVAVITGDVINSRGGKTKDWLSSLKQVLNHYGEEPKDWEIFRGDSFQLSLQPKNALIATIHIKAVIKQSKSQDVRMGIGLGEETHKAPKVTESNGSAYILSGECFDALKKQTLSVKSHNSELNEMLNLMLSLSLLTANSWTPIVAEVIKTALENPEKNQKKLAMLLNKSQSSVSEALKRGGFEEIMAMNNFYKGQIQNL
tara:strand:+ start:110 stop:709 length:600 start_codon:yes stop_codon:yes gene_type:complete